LAPLVPLVPLVPLEPLDPLVPSTPLVPLDPLVPLVPLVPAQTPLYVSVPPACTTVPTIAQKVTLPIPFAVLSLVSSQAV